MRQAEIVMDNLGPCLCRAQNVNGVAATKAKRKAVDSQLITLSVVLKYVAAVSETGAKAIQSQGHDDIEEDKLDKAEESTFVHLIIDDGSCGDSREISGYDGPVLRLRQRLLVASP